jgi:hypothetical protein
MNRLEVHLGPANRAQFSPMCSEARMARAITVSWGFTPREVGKTLASHTKRFSKPRTWE